MKTSLILILLLLFSAAAFPVHAQGASPGMVDVTFGQNTSFGFVPNGPIRGIAPLANGQVLIGGAINQPQNRLGLARLNANGSPDPTFTNDLQFISLSFSGTVKRILPRPDGMFYIHGAFNYVSQRPGYTNLALFDADGNHVTNFVPTGLGIDITLARLAVTSDNKLLVNLNSNLVQRLDSNGVVEASFILTNIINIRSLAGIPGGGFFVGTSGSFFPQADALIARYDANGLPDATFSPPAFENTPGQPAFSLGVPVVQPDGKPIVLGFFTLVGGVQRGGIARLNLNGTLDTTFVPGPNGLGTIYNGSLIGIDGISPLPDGRFIIFRGGPFRYGGAYRNGIGRINAAGALDASFDPGDGPAGQSFSYSPDGWGIETVGTGPNGEVFVGGSFTNFNHTGRKYFVRLNPGAANAKPTVLTPPQSQSVASGADVVFSVVVTGPKPFSYVWRHNNKIIPGATSDTITITNVQLADVGGYIVTVANSAGGVAAAPAVLTVNGVSVPDLTGPSFKITSPAGTFVRTTTGSFTFSGTAKDNLGLAAVCYQQDSNAWVQIPLMTNWTFLVNLHPGTNLFRVKATDVAGNNSATQKVVAFYAVTQAVNLAITGNGTVSGATNGQGLEIGRNYTLIAAPNPGNLFSNWMANGTVALNPALTFFMWSNSTVSANFVANPFLTAKGIYNGLVMDPNNVAFTNSGMISLKVTDKGVFTGKLLLGGANLPLAGNFGVDGKAGVKVNRIGKPALTNQLVLDLVSKDALGGTVSDGAFTNSIQADKAIFSATNLSPYAGKYTLIIPGTNEVSGDGIGTVSLSSAGTITFSGALADGTVVNQSVPVSRTGWWPVYLPLYAGKGMFISWAQFDTNGTIDLHGDAVWTKNPMPGKYYTNGFKLLTRIEGGEYEAPAVGPTNLVLSMTNGTVTLSSGTLSTPIVNGVVLTNNNVIRITGTNGLKLTITPSSGLVSGSFIHPVTKLVTPIKAVVQQGRTNIDGYFLGPNASGTVLLQR